MRDILLVRPESRWRWLPLALTPFAFAAWAAQAARRDEPALILIMLALTVAAFGSAGWLGYFGAYKRAQAEVLLRDCVRVSTHPRLALVLKIVGCIMFAAALLGLVWPHRDWSSLPRDVANRIGTLLFFGFPVAYAGWQRPWDLKVVERDGSDA